MDFSKSKVLLKKINTLHESADSFDQAFSSLEKDLFLQYLRDLYECVANLDENRQGKMHKAHSVKNEKIIKPKLQVPTKEYLDEAKQQNDSVRTTVTNGSNHEAKTASQVATLEVSEKDDSLNWDTDLTELFGAISSSEPSNRFANAPLTDISKAMGINERILTINELFNGNQQLFQEVIGHLNDLNSYEQAVQYLGSGIAAEHKWGHKKRNQKAEVFLNIVRRRYL